MSNSGYPDSSAPFSSEAEEAVLGAILSNSNAYFNVAAYLKAEDFFLLRHQRIWQAVQRIAERNEEFDYLTVTEELSNMGVLDEIGGPMYLLRLVNATPTSIHAELYGKLVEKASIRRRLLIAADEIKSLALNESLDIDKVTEEAEARLFGVTESQQRSDLIPVSDVIGTYFEQVEYLMQNQGQAMGLPTGFRDLDKLLGGLQRSDLLIFAGRPGMGKCTAEGTLIPTEMGLLPIEKLKPADVEGIPDNEGGVYYPLQIGVLTPDGVRQTAYFYDSGIKPTLRLTTRAGYSLAGTYFHAVLTLAPNGETTWKTLYQLQPGEFVAVQRRTKHTKRTHLRQTPLDWDRVTAVKADGMQHCYDLTVPEGHAFIANGIVNHNTSFLLSVTLNAARYDKRVAIFTMEMGREQIVQRLISMETGINMQRLRLGQLEPQEWSRFVEAAGRLSDLKIYIDDTPAITPMQMRAKSRRMAREEGVDLIIVDYLQLMNSGGVYENNRVQEISYISRGLKELARELNVPVFSAAQLSRAVEQRQDKRPQLSDLRESGSIEQDSDIVIFLYRDEVYNDAAENPNEAEVIIAKHRNGPTGMVSLYFDKQITRFLNASAHSIDLSRS